MARATSDRVRSATFAITTAYKLIGSQKGKKQKVEVKIAYAFKLNVPGK